MRITDLTVDHFGAWSGLKLEELSSRLTGQATKLKISPDRDPLAIGTGMIQAPRS